MSDIEHDLPDITVEIVPDVQYITDITPSEIYQVEVNVGDVFSVNLQEPDIIVANGSSSIYDMAQLAGYALYAGTASYAANAVLPPGIITSSGQIGLNQISGSVFNNTYSTFTFPKNLTVGGTLIAQNLQVSSSTIYSSGSTKFGDSANDTHQFTGSLAVKGPISAQSVTGSFKGDGSQLTGLVTDLRISGSTGGDTVSLLTDTLSVVGIHGVTTKVTNNQITIDIPTGFATTASNTFVNDQVISGSLDVTGDIWVMPGVVNQLTSSYAIKAENIGVIDAGIYQTGSNQAISPTLGIQQITSASYSATASYALFGGPTPIFTSSVLVVDTYYFEGDGITTNFTLQNLYDSDSVIVTVGGVTFISPNDFTISGTTVEFIEPPYSSSIVYVRGLLNVLTSGSFNGLASTSITSSYAFTSSYALDSVTATSSSYSSTASYALTTDIDVTTFATTGSNSFTGDQSITGSLTITGITDATGSFSGSFAGISNYAVTASYITDLILANTEPLVPQLGSVYFSGSFLYIYDGTQYKSASLN